MAEENETQVVEKADLEDLSELLKLRPWQKDRLGYWFDHVPQAKEARDG